MLKSASSHSAQKLNFQKLNVSQIQAYGYCTKVITQTPDDDFHLNHGFVTQAEYLALASYFQILWMAISKCLGNPHSALLAFRTAFLIASIKFMLTKADFR